MFDMCMLNALVLYKVQVGGIQQPSLRLFSKGVIAQLLEKFGRVTAVNPRRHSDTQPDRLEAKNFLSRHVLVSMPLTRAGGRVSQGTCRVCSMTTRRPRTRKSTSYRCSECLVPLCANQCFNDYHTLQRF